MKKAGTSKGQAKALDREVFWRQVIQRWQESGQRQADFCRQENIKTTTFSTWKERLRRRDAGIPSPAARVPDVSPRRQAVKASKSVDNRGAKSGKSTPSFVRLEIDEAKDYTAKAPSKEQVPVDDVPAANQLLAAELIDQATSRRLRIFNGADSATLSAVIAAMAVS